MRDKIINLHSSAITDKETLKKAVINNTSKPDQNILQGEIAVVNTAGSEGIYTLNSDGTDVIEFKPLSKEEKDQISALISGGIKDEVYVGNDEPSGEETIWIDTDETPDFAAMAVPEAPKDGKQYVRQNANWTEIIPGDKTNVLILDYEKDLANGKTGSTVTPEVSAALLDAVDKGKACVVKSGNSDILANLQKITDHVQIIMEQISYFEGTFLGSNTIVSVDTTGNTISNLSSGAIELVDKSNVLTKDNTKEFTPDADYEPATKKYVDDNILSIVELECNPDDGIDELEYQTILKEYSIALFKYKGELCYKVERDDKPVMTDSRHDFTLYTEHYIVLVKESDLTVTETIIPDHKVLSESQYTALGETVNTDGVLYFVTPDE